MSTAATTYTAEYTDRVQPGATPPHPPPGGGRFAILCKTIQSVLKSPHHSVCAPECCA